MNYIFKLISVLVLIWAILSSSFSWVSADLSGEDAFFIVTAYYSPLPWQSRYATGSYAWDIRLNGPWKVTASWKEVFEGLLAAPTGYDYGTKIHFKWYGVGQVEDRWWAIVRSGVRWYEHDRIDIWMWYGDEGLARALTWGTRTIKWKIVVPSAEVSLSFWESKIWALTSLDVNPENSKSEDVLALQEIFTKAELYTWNLDGEYESIKSELIEYQLKSWIITSANDDSAGWYWPKTIAALREDYWNNTSTLIEEPIEEFSSYNHKWASEKYKIILTYGDLQVWPDSKAESIIQLQNLLIELGEYSGSIDGNYNSIEESLIDLQKKIWLIRNDDDWGAWYFWNKTKSALWKYYEEIDMGEEDLNGSVLTQAEKNALDATITSLKVRYSSKTLKILKEQIDAIINDKAYAE